MIEGRLMVLTMLFSCDVQTERILGLGVWRGFGKI